jgi:O-antigen ligase
MSTVAYAALWVFVFSVPWERILVLPGISIIPKATGAVAVSLALLAAVMTGRFRRWHPFHVMAVLFIIWAGFVLLVRGDSPQLPNKFWTWPQLMLMVWMTWEIARSEQRLRGLLLAYVLGAYVAALDTVLIYRQQAGALRRFAAGGADPNDLAMILALALPMAWYLGLTYRQPVLRWICRAYLPVCVVAVGLTGSRGGMIATTVGLLIVPFSMTRLSPGRMFSAVMMLLVAGALAVVYTPDTLIQRLASTGTEVEGGRLGGRGKLWKAGLEAFADKPIIGYGTGLFREAITPMLGEAAQVAHNSFISVLVEQGLVGLLLYVGIFGAVVLSVRRLDRLGRRFALVLLATLFVTMLPLTWEDRRAVWVIFTVLLGLAYAPAGWPMEAAAPAAPPPVPVPTRRPPPRPMERPVGRGRFGPAGPGA